jgi:3-methyladenine DNA glycosylase AlkD
MTQISSPVQIHPYFEALHDLFEEHADSENAFQMKKYMKERFEYWGIKSPLRRELIRDFLKANGKPEAEELPEIVKALWQMPQREFHYFAQELAEKFVKNAGKDFLELIEYLITTKSWWDTVDFIATHLAAKFFRQYPEMIYEVSARWMNSGNMWLQRSALLFQLKYKTNTDTELLFSYIRQLSGSKEFFIRKAIGWTLREYSKTDAQAVLQFLDETELSPFSQREALKWLIAKEKI